MVSAPLQPRPVPKQPFSPAPIPALTGKTISGKRFPSRSPLSHFTHRSAQFPAKAFPAPRPRNLSCRRSGGPCLLDGQPRPSRRQKASAAGSATPRGRLRGPTGNGFCQNRPSAAFFRAKNRRRIRPGTVPAQARARRRAAPFSTPRGAREGKNKLFSPYRLVLQAVLSYTSQTSFPGKTKERKDVDKWRFFLGATPEAAFPRPLPQGQVRDGSGATD